MKFEFVEIQKMDSYAVDNETVYDLTVEEDHSYCVDDNIIVHNSVCETRKVTGIGYPQLSCVLESAEVAHGVGGLVCSDGGCRNPGDIVKAFGAGADGVMIGGLLAGHEECEGEWEYTYDSNLINGVPNFSGEKKKAYLKFYGMSSREAMEKYYGGVADYKACEGKCIKVEYKGSVENIIQQILGGLRSACAYVGANKLKDLSKCTTFVRIK